MNVPPMPRLLAASVLALALLAAACGGGSTTGPTEDPGAGPRSVTPVTSVTTVPTATAAAASTPVPTPVPRADGLTGAPVAPPTAASAEFDPTLLNVNAGSFPPLDYPRLVSAAEAKWLSDDALILGAVQNGEARAYPLSMMRFHHVANDSLGGEPYLVTF